MLNRKFNLDYLDKYKIYFQIEHNLVLDGGRSITHKIKGNVKYIYDESQFYLVRIVNLEEYDKYDYIIEYSYPNIENIKLSNYFNKEFINKILYLPPLIYDYIDYKPVRNINILTTFIDTTQTRRQLLLNKMEQSNINFKNVNNIFDKNELKNLYDKTKILLNIHQTDFHHTLEEFRILPALSRNVIIISEEIPLKYTIPYNKYIIWCNYDNVLEILNVIDKNYDEYYEKFFGKESKLKDILKDLEDEAYKNINNKLN